MGEKGSTTFGNKDAMFPGIKREDHRVVLWREHVSKEAKNYPRGGQFAIVDPGSLVLVDGKPPMATRPKAGSRYAPPVAKRTSLFEDPPTEDSFAAKQAAAWGRESARRGTWGRRSARHRLSMSLGQRAEPLLETVSMPDVAPGETFRAIEDLPADFTFDIGEASRTLRDLLFFG